MWCRNPSFKSCHSSIGFSRCDDQDRRPAASHANLASRKGAYSSRVNVCRRMLQAGSLFPQPGPERGPKESDKVQTSTYERSDREKERERERESLLRLTIVTQTEQVRQLQFGTARERPATRRITPLSGVRQADQWFSSLLGIMAVWTHAKNSKRGSSEEAVLVSGSI